MSAPNTILILRKITHIKQDSNSESEISMLSCSTNKCCNLLFFFFFIFSPYEADHTSDSSDGKVLFTISSKRTLLNKTRQINIQNFYKIIFFKYRTRQIKSTETNKKVTISIKISNFFLPVILSCLVLYLKKDNYTANLYIILYY